MHFSRPIAIFLRNVLAIVVRCSVFNEDDEEYNNNKAWWWWSLQVCLLAACFAGPFRFWENIWNPWRFTKKHTIVLEVLQGVTRTMRSRSSMIAVVSFWCVPLEPSRIWSIGSLKNQNGTLGPCCSFPPPLLITINWGQSYNFFSEFLWFVNGALEPSSRETRKTEKVQMEQDDGDDDDGHGTEKIHYND